ncbi:M10 family metallopeptidase C-terminal domain-containing protein [Microvirga brassicacearum]|uniref:Peptidase M10 serralysin C-terminal domain-containing protein n=1 Tax=Microvirga brassicacearum TaxID=2580413 RepID=A0A5N3PC62_9HYPH|nr:hypothetical protein [Microvirga brassicacearum]KAB0267293.1 hypothetical protein FEZ63_08200 [Microvirga brassicacearum]
MRPTTSEFMKAAYWTYQQTAGPSPFLINGKPMTSLNVGAGFFAAASVTSAGNVIVAFEGTDIEGFSDNPEFVINQIAADFLIYRGGMPTAYGLALSFTQSVIAAAKAQGISRDNIYITGHSLGGAEAAYVAAQLNLPGETYGAPGISKSLIPAGASSQLVNYVEHGDPVGNYSADTFVEQNLLFSNNIARFGNASFLGPYWNNLLILAANGLLGPGTSQGNHDAAYGLLLESAYDHHLLGHYAQSLGVQLPNTTSGLSQSQFIGLVEQIVNDPANKTVIARAGDDVVRGNAKANTLKGYAGNDLLIGGKGADKLHGGVGEDSFVFKRGDSKAAPEGRDIIFDFSHKEHDSIDLSWMDASTSRKGNQAFKFIGKSAFHEKAGELRYEKADGGAIVYGDVNGDGEADFSIAVQKIAKLVKGDFVL